MSIEAIGWVLRDAPGVPAQCLGVLIGLAEHADEHGRGAYPSAPTLAGYARKSERQVRYDLALLADGKLIRPGDQSLAAWLPVNRRPVVYDLAVELKAGVQSASPQAGVQSASGVQPTAPMQPTAPQTAPDLQERSGVQPTAPLMSDLLGCNTAQLGVQPTADKPSSKPEEQTLSRRSDPNADREDIRRLCAHMADVVAANGFTRPTTTKAALDAARLMLDRDGRTEEQVHKAIDWAAQDGFWYKNVRSMAKLREQYERMQADAKPSRNGHRPGAQQRVSPHDEHRMRR